MFSLVVKTCDEIRDEDLVISTMVKSVGGALRLRDVATASGGRAFVQLPECYAPRGLLCDFEGGVRLELRAQGDASVAGLAKLRAVLIACLDRGLALESGPAPKRGACKRHVPVAADGDAKTTLRGRRAADVRGFRLLEDVGGAPRCATRFDGEVLAGERVLAIASIEHVWFSADGRAGVRLALQQYMLCEPVPERCLFRGLAPREAEAAVRAGTLRGAGPKPPPPPPHGAKAAAAATVSGSGPGSAHGALMRELAAIGAGKGPVLRKVPPKP
jgi:hypothetical protein